MQRWAASGKYPHVKFFCINASETEQRGYGLKIGREFAMKYQLTHVINGYFEPSAMPTFGQLGCSGFIFSDSSGSVIKSATPPFLQYGPEAFAWVERMLDSYNPIPNLNRPSDAIRIRIQGIRAQPQLNGQFGSLLRKDEKNPQRFIVLLDSGQQISVQAQNFEEIDEEDEQQQQEKSIIDSSTEPTTIDTHLGVPAMDEEHEQCEKVLQQLLEERTPSALKSALFTLRNHFTHEEDLMRQVGFGGYRVDLSEQELRISGFYGHLADHQQLIQNLQQLSAAQNSEGKLPEDAIKKLLQKLREHIDRYDRLYSDALTACTS
jgi:hemerythrin